MDLLSGEPPPMSTGLPDRPKFRENHRGCVRSVHNAVWVEDSSSVKAPEEHLSTSILEASAPAGQVRAWQSLSRRVTLDRLALWIESGYPIVSTHPEIAVVIFEDAPHCISRHAVRPRVDGERTRLGIEFVESILRTGPHRT